MTFFTDEQRASFTDAQLRTLAQALERLADDASEEPDETPDHTTEELWRASRELDQELFSREP